MAGPSDGLLGVAAELVATMAAARIEVGVAAKKVIADELKRDIGSDMTMSGFRKGKGLKLSSGFEVDGDDVVINPRPVGPWVLLDSGSDKRSWLIPRRRSIRRARGKQRVVNGVKAKALSRGGKDQGIRPFVVHPAVRGKGTWERARRSVVDEAPEIVTAAVVKAMS